MNEMTAKEKGAYVRCCNYLVEMMMKYGKGTVQQKEEESYESNAVRDN